MHRIVVTLVLGEKLRPFPLWAFEAHGGWPDHNVLIGRDTIRRGVLRMTGDWSSFGVPNSQAESTDGFAALTTWTLYFWILAVGCTSGSSRVRRDQPMMCRSVVERHSKALVSNGSFSCLVGHLRVLGAARGQAPHLGRRSGRPVPRRRAAL